MPFYISLSGYSLEREDKMYDIKKTGEIIKKLRKQKGKTQECVAEEMGINIKTYRAIETGTRGGSIDTMCLIAEYFACSLDYLIYGIREKNEIMDFLNRLDDKRKNKVIEIIKEIIVAMTD